jgi:hypothetical protein
MRAQLVGQFETEPTLSILPGPFRDLLININLATDTVSRLKKPSESEIEKLYNKSPASTGVLCLSHILVKTKAQAIKALKQISNGAKFADVAKKVSIEPGAKTSGGSLASGDEPCIPLEPVQDPQSGLLSNFLVGAVAAKPGVPTQPVKTEFGWHIILSHPYSEVKDSVSSIISEDPGAILFTGFLATSDIRLNSQYGTWVPATAKIS